MSSKRLDLMVIVLALCTGTSAYANLIQVTEDFSTNTDGVWESFGNRTSPQNFGWSGTDHTGTGAGELGGVFHRTDTSGLSFYGVNVGGVTMQDAWSFSGVVRFVQDDPDRSAQNAQIGYFTLPSSVDFSTPPPNSPASGPKNWVGILLNNGQRPFLRSRDQDNTQHNNSRWDDGSADLQVGVTSAFSVSFDPDTRGLTMTIDGQSLTTPLSIFAQGNFEPFTHFGVLSAAPDGSWAEVYFDDLTFTAVPEPGVAAIFGGLVTVSLLRRQRRRL